MNVTPKTMARQITVSAQERAEIARVRRVATREVLVYSSTTPVANRVMDVTGFTEEREPHCFVCGRHTDHFAEHDDMVEKGFATYSEDGDVFWTEKGWNEYRA